jgi:SAM-dependent methyltransferase
LKLNRGFYQSFAEAFGESRARLQPGVLRALEGLAPQADVLDLGCGNGELAAELGRRGHAGVYVGLDSSEALLALARERVKGPGSLFVLADLVDEGWPGRALEALAELWALGGSGARAEARALGGRGKRADSGAADVTSSRPFDLIFALAVLHHVPSEGLRIRLLGQAGSLLADGGRLTLSVWNFLASPRLRKRIVPWEEAGLAERDLDPGDFLLDWRRGGRGLRYVHHFTEPELAALAAAADFRVISSYLSDGGLGLLGRYQVWERLS